jgi:hypothetical protein
MTTEDLDKLKSLKKRFDDILKDYDGLPEALQKVGLTTESNLAKLSEERLDYIYSRIDEKINENEPITADQDAEAKWEANTNR